MATKQPRAEGDLYATPLAIIDTILPYLPKDIGRVLDPAAGDDRFRARLGHLAGEWHSLDIAPGAEGVEAADFLAWAHEGYHTRKGTVDTVITNPPFSLIENFIVDGLGMNPKRLIYLARLSVLESGGRYERLWRHARYQPKRVIILPNRPSFRGKGKTDQWAYAWFCWGDVLGRGLGWAAPVAVKDRRNEL